jgi:hypothetical protein
MYIELNRSLFVYVRKWSLFISTAQTLILFRIWWLLRGHLEATCGALCGGGGHSAGNAGGLIIIPAECNADSLPNRPWQCRGANLQKTRPFSPDYQLPYMQFKVKFNKFNFRSAALLKNRHSASIISEECSYIINLGIFPSWNMLIICDKW